MPINKLVNDYCKNRIKSVLLNDVKTEALLVFGRTALERYFAQIDEANYIATVGKESDTFYVYETLRKLLKNLQDSVVNVDYFIRLSEESKKSPPLKELAKYEEPLIYYYNEMAKEIAGYYNNKTAYLPEYVVICVLSDWLLEEEKSMNLYPFLKDIDFLELMGKFESNRKEFQRDDKCTISEIHEVASLVIEKLKSTKYKSQNKRVSKIRKKK